MSDRFLSEDGMEISFNLKLLEDKRKKVSEIKGSIVKDLGILKNKKIISVGDRVTKELLASGKRPEVVIIDLKERREMDCSAIFYLDEYFIVIARNPAGTLTREAWLKVKKAIEISLLGKNVAVIVDGEEDLLGFPAVILPPEGWIVVYGQPGVGIVSITIDRRTKEEAISLLQEAFLPI
jgi:uncharacterized protein (UPF0218 family)